MVEHQSNLIWDDFPTLAIQEFVRERTYEQNHVDPKFYSAVALQGEVGEVCNLLKKDIFYADRKPYRDRVDNEIKSGDRMTLAGSKEDELGDCLFYLVQTINACGLSVRDVWRSQLAKFARQDEEIGEIYKK